MREVIDDINGWRKAGEPVALATVVKTWGSAPRKVGAKMGLTPAGQISGSVSGGCVEGAVFEEGTAALSSNQARLIHYGVADETAWEVGLACGGQIEVFVEPLAPAAHALVAARLAADDPLAIATIIRGAGAVGRKWILDNDGVQLAPDAPHALDGTVVAAAAAALADGKTRRLALSDDVELFVDVQLPKPLLVMVGGVHIAVALTAMANALGFRTVVVDPRRAFGSLERFPHVDALIQKWPQKAFAEIKVNQSTAIALLTHDPKIDDPALHAVLDSRAFYIGALGSTRTHAKRVARLEEAGFSAAQIARIHAPIGLDINAQTPEEIAVSVLAEIVAARRR